MAAAGELSPEPGGEPLEPFEIPEASVSDIISKAERRKRGELLRQNVATMPAKDRVEHFQRRLSGMIDAEMDRLEKEQRKGRSLDAEQIRRLARAIRELSTLPDAKDMRLPRTPGDRVPGTGELPDAKTTGGLAGRLLAASNRHAAATETPRRADHISHQQSEDETRHTDKAGENSDEQAERSETHDTGRDERGGGPCQTQCAGAGVFSAAEVLAGA